MVDSEELARRNDSFSRGFSDGGLPIRPRLNAIVLACIDARVDPAHLFGLHLGDAVVFRNPGARITPTVIRDLGVLAVLSSLLPGPAMAPELVVVAHTDCGMSRLTDPQVQAALADRLGLGPAEIAELAVADPAGSVAADLDRLRHTPGVPPQVVVSGYVYDVASGRVERVVEPAPLGGGR